MKAILVSGWATDSMIWYSVARVLKDELDIDVEYFDWRRGLEDGLTEVLSLESEQVILAGWSIGGQMVLKAAGEMPDSVAGLVLVSSMCCLARTEHRPGVNRDTSQQIAEMLVGNRNAYMRSFFSECLSPHRDDDLLSDLLRRSGRITGEDLAAGLEYMFEQEAEPEVRVPLMVVHGRRDSIVPWTCSRYIAERNADSDSVYLENEGHMLPVVSHRILGERIIEFTSSACT